jgi:signal transduction histidine kinase
MLLWLTRLLHVLQRSPAGLRGVSLQWKLGVLVLCGLCLLSSSFVALGEMFTEESARNMAAERLSVARLTATLLDRQFNRQFMQLDWVAGQVDLDTSGTQDRLQGYADLLRMSEPNVSDIFVIDAQGRRVWSDGADLGFGSDLSNQPFVLVPLNTGQHYASSVFEDPTTKRPLVLFSVPISGPNADHRGVLAVSLELSEALSRVLLSAAAELGPGGHAELVDQNLRLIATNEPGRTLGPAEHPTFYAPLMARHESSVGLTDPIGDEDPQDRGQRHIMAFVPLKDVPWGLGLGGSETAFTAMTDRWRAYSIPLAALAPAIALVLVWLTRRRVVGPLQRLTHSSQAIADGDLTTPIPPSGDAEVQVLAQNLDTMRTRLKRARDAEEELSRLKDDFLAIASHELRTPVAALSALTQLQRKRLERGVAIDYDEALTEIHCHLDRLAGLAGRLLDSARIQTGKLTLEPQAADLSQLVRSGIESVQMTHPQREFQLQAPDAVQAIADPVRFEQVVVNLLDNAAKHTPVGSPVVVSLSQPTPGYAQLVVRDHGPGIPAADRQHIFERYFRQVRTDEGTRPGLGLGLYVSREIVSLHGGVIQVDSPSGGGTAFVVTMPTARS